MSALHLSRFCASHPENAALNGSAPLDADIVRRIKRDFREMPGLCLTTRQGARLWNIAPEVSTTFLDALVADGFLSRSGEHYRLP